MDLEANEDFIDQETFDRAFLNKSVVDYNCDHIGRRIVKSQGEKTSELFFYEDMPKFIIFDINRGEQQMITEDNIMSDQIQLNNSILVRCKKIYSWWTATSKI